MFRRIFMMDCRRCFSPVKIGITICLLTLILVFSERDMIQASTYVTGNDTGIVQVLEHLLQFDKFKLIIIFLLAGVYTNSFCADDDSHFLRMVLGRIDVTTYTQSRFLVNVLSIVAVSVAGFLFTTLLLLPSTPIAGASGAESSYYSALAMEYPLLYIIIMGFQFGVVAAACSSIGLLFSAFQANKFVSIGLPGFVFFLAISYIPSSSVFDVLALVGMTPSFVKSFDGYQTANLIWGILYPAVVIILCGYLFYRRLKWRVENGMV